jgi:hypothetical membrane protein
MSVLSLLSIAGVVIWVALVVTAQLLNPAQSWLVMGMSGLARGRHGWIMKLAFVVRGVAALALVWALQEVVPRGALMIAGLLLFWVWGVGSASLARFDTDMPGEPPSRAGAAHVLIALIAYVGAVAGMLLLSPVLGREQATAGVARWALLIALVAAVAMCAQFAGFGAAAKQARAAAGAPAPPRGLARYAGLLQRVFLALVMLWTVVVAAGI